ncbi:MAG: VapB-type antitoxin [archaeon]|nr:VapB-type antitoxin [archaeon]MCP8314756.1 VapB-type antitoxin [archaeon]MCP8315850.1 VapB-type antitoxin [archaeon]MCP8321468.1 VapB-type antitoxin [archaeon]
MSTTVKISRNTLIELEKLKEELKTRSLDEAIKMLIKRYRSQILNEAFGVDRGRVRPFTEEDRGEER